LRSKHQNILDTIRNSGDMSDKTDAELAAVVEDFIPNCGLKLIKGA